MARVEIAESLYEEIEKRFRRQATEVFDLIHSCEEHPTKGKTLGTVGGIVIKELKYQKYRFYFLTDGFTLKMLDETALADLLLRFVRMSDKNRQQETIREIRAVLTRIGPGGFT